MNRAVIRDKILGCWTGKNIGGTLGAPFENKQEIFDVSFYTTDLKGDPIPNDDLDLQLIWLHAVEQKGLYHINERVLGEYWLAHVVGPWEEYGICRNNMINGFYPPLSGICGNEKWYNGNGAWIRSEIWACLFPGSPDEVSEYAWYDACVDHGGDGIYAEIFTATLEAAAFIESDIRRLINIALAHIPEDCRVARSVKIAMAEYDAGHDFVTARNAVVKDSEDIGWFHAPANVAFTVIGLLYGEGDFAKTICTAVNCGDDADCTGATAGAVMGIIMGRSKLPQEWIDPIGEKIKTWAIDPFGANVPETLDDLTDRVMTLLELNVQENPTLPALTDGETYVTPEYREMLLTSRAGYKRIMNRSSRQAFYTLPWGEVSVEYEKSPLMEAGTTQKLKLRTHATPQECTTVYFDWNLPEEWSCSPSKTQAVMVKRNSWQDIDFEITMPENVEALTYIPVTVRLSTRNRPEQIMIPFGLKSAIRTIQELNQFDQGWWDNKNRIDARLKKQKKQ